VDVETHQTHKDFVTDHIQTSNKKAQNYVLGFFIIFGKKSMTKNLAHLVLGLNLLLTISSFSQTNKLSSMSVPPHLKENANAVFRDNSIEITIEAADRMLVKNTQVVTVLNKKGNVDARIVEAYDDDTKITKLSAKIYDAFGNEIKKYTKNKFIDISAVSGGTLYSDSRVKYIDYIPVAYPYTLVFESEYRTSSTGFIPRWIPNNGYYVGVEKSTYILNNPLKIKLRTKEKSFKGYPIENLSTGVNLHYVIKNQKALKPENLSSSYLEYMPHLMVASNEFALKKVTGRASNWKEFGEWMHRKLIQDRDILDVSTIEKIKSLVADITDPIEKAKIVYKFVQDKTRYISVQVGIGGWEPIAANQVDQVGYGDCKGLTNYTKALLDAVGVKSYFTLVYAQQKRNIVKDFSSMQGNHAILNIPNNGNDIWLECTSQTIPFGFLGDFTDDRDVLVITPEGGIIKRTPAYFNEDNLQTIDGSIQLYEDGSVKASLERVSHGIQYDQKSRYDSMSEEDLKKHYKTKDWSYNNNLEINSVALENDKDSVVFTEKMKTSITDYATINENDYLFRVNMFNRDTNVPKRYRDRTLPLKISRGYQDIDQYSYVIPKGYTFADLPEEKNITTKFGSYKVSFTKIDATTFIYKKSLLIKAGDYPKEDYKDYRKFRKSIARYENLRISLIKTN
jgi:hypothetical protein